MDNITEITTGVTLPMLLQSSVLESHLKDLWNSFPSYHNGWAAAYVFCWQKVIPPAGCPAGAVLLLIPPVHTVLVCHAPWSCALRGQWSFRNSVRAQRVFTVRRNWTLLPPTHTSGKLKWDSSPFLCMFHGAYFVTAELILSFPCSNQHLG